MGEKVDSWRTLDAHIGITQGGICYILQPFDLQIWHGNGLSPFTIGIEFEGSNEGIPGYPKQGAGWFYIGGKTELTKSQISASEELFALLQSEFNAHHQPWVGVWGHRQSSKSRQCDPGHEIWKSVGVPWRRLINCFPYQLQKTWGDGSPIPVEWDAESNSKFWK